MAIKELNGLTFYENVEKTEGLAVVDFSAPWCGPCKVMDPILEELAEEMGGEIGFFRVNVDDAVRVVQRYGIRSIPTIGFFHGEEQVGAVVGVKPKAALKEAIEKAQGEVAQGV